MYFLRLLFILKIKLKLLNIKGIRAISEHTLFCITVIGTLGPYDASRDNR